MWIVRRRRTLGAINSIVSWATDGAARRDERTGGEDGWGILRCGGAAGGGGSHTARRLAGQCGCARRCRLGRVGTGPSPGGRGGKWQALLPQTAAEISQGAAGVRGG